VCSVLNYCGSGWQPWLSESNVKTLDACQNRALRIVTGQLQSTPLEALRLEAEVPSMHTTIRRNAATAWEKTLRLPPTNPRSTLVQGPVHRLKGKSSWREMARREEAELGLSNLPRAPFPLLRPPWGGARTRRWTACADIRPCFAAGAPADQRRKMTIDHIKARGPYEWSIYTDGTPGDFGRDSGAAAVVCTGPPDGIVVKAVRRRRGGVLSSPYEAELEGLRLALEWLQTLSTSTRGQVLIAIDCKALVLELAQPSSADDSTLAELVEALDDLSFDIVIQWVPSHCGIEGNEEADREASRATTGRKREEEGVRGIPLHTAKAVIRRQIVDPPTVHLRTKAIYQGKRGRADLTRKEAVLLAQLRSGHCRRLAAYRSIVEDGYSPICPFCNLEQETITHWLQECTATADKRRNAFGTTSPNMSVLFQDQVAVRAFSQSLWTL
jgi:ribonuclease HI